LSAHPPELILERVLRGESLAAPWPAHLEGCAECARRLAEMRQEDARYRATPQAQRLAARLREGPLTPRRPGRAAWLAVLVPSVTVALVAVLWIHSTHQESGFTAKGGGLEASVGREGRVAAWDGAPLRNGDVLQLAWSSGKAGYLAVMVREVDGRVTTVFPPQGDSAGAIEAGPHQPLGGSLRVDGRPLEVVALFADRPFALASLRAALGRGAPLEFSGRRQTLKLPGTPQ